MKKVLFICMGNICRSSMAEGILRDRIEKQGLALLVDSAGTHGYHQGKPYDQRAREELAKQDINVDDLRSRQVSAADFDTFDVIFAADQSNITDLAAGFGEKANKVKLMTAYSEQYFGLDVPDPYYGDSEGFAKVYEMLAESIDTWLKQRS